MPEPGPEYYAARRRLWLAPPVNPSVSKSRGKALESAIISPDRDHTATVWRVLSTGRQLKNNLPLEYLIKIVHAAWLRDRTWPVGAVAPDSDDDPSANQQGNASNAT